MAEETDFHKLVFAPVPERALRDTPEHKYWQRFKTTATLQQVGAVTHIDFRAARPHHYAVTSSTRVIVHDATSPAHEVKRQITRFQDKAYSGNFRLDGQLLVAGAEDGLVQVFDVNSRTCLRRLQGHAKPAHLARFSLDGKHVFSGSDDATARWWDVAAGEQVLRLDGHRDYVRCGAAHPSQGDTIATGGYDHAVRLWDARAGECALTMDHGAPVEDVLFLPPGGLIATAGGNSIAIWDLLAGGRLLTRLVRHQKLVTALCWAPSAGPASSAGPRLLSGSLDGYVKVHTLDGFDTVQSFHHPAPVLSVGIAPSALHLAVGCSNGALVVRRRQKAPPDPQEAPPGALPYAPERRPRPLTAANYRYFLRGQAERPGAGDHVVATQKGPHLQPYEQLLRKFRYAEALDAALATREAAAVAAVLADLAVRHGLEAALGDRDAGQLLPLLDHVRGHLLEGPYQRDLLGLLERILDLYAPALGISPAVDRRVRQLQSLVREELRAQEGLLAVQGMVQLLLATAMGAAPGAGAPQPRALPGEGPEEEEEAEEFELESVPLAAVQGGAGVGPGAGAEGEARRQAGAAGLELLQGVPRARPARTAQLAT